ncbi:MAG: aldo/keto reductase [Lachnospiraceae bacterium]|nr:aldo/keto reductase [Lachnospiraceae bacterium]
MQYRVNQKNQKELSVLGFGCMRFTKNGSAIDQKKANTELLRALDNGVNYFDTAYIYSGSEVCLGKFMAEYGCRDRMNIATKLPQYLIKKPGDIDRYFNEQLSRLGTDHIEYYLMHMLNDARTWERLCGMGIDTWLQSKKAEGKIQNIGFSFHGGTESFKELVDAYDWDFCQIQYNYMDEYAQAGVEGLRHAHAKGIPVVIMEPLRGGRLVNNLPEGALKEFDRMPHKRTPADWGLRWLWNQKEVNVVLSGMNDVAQVDENCRIAAESTVGCLSDEELALYPRVLAEIHKAMKVGCTGCGYCQPCPQGVDIPTCFGAYNNSYRDYFVGFREYIMCTTMRKKRTNASLCIGCGKCEQHCPQHIEIRMKLKDVKRRMENPVYKVAAAAMGVFMKY